MENEQKEWFCLAAQLENTISETIESDWLLRACQFFNIPIEKFGSLEEKWMKNHLQHKNTEGGAIIWHVSEGKTYGHVGFLTGKNLTAGRTSDELYKWHNDKLFERKQFKPEILDKAEGLKNTEKLMKEKKIRKQMNKIHNKIGFAIRTSVHSLLSAVVYDDLIETTKDLKEEGEWALFAFCKANKFMWKKCPKTLTSKRSWVIATSLSKHDHRECWKPAVDIEGNPIEKTITPMVFDNEFEELPKDIQLGSTIKWEGMNLISTNALRNCGTASLVGIHMTEVPRVPNTVDEHKTGMIMSKTAPPSTFGKFGSKKLSTLIHGKVNDAFIELLNKNGAGIDKAAIKKGEGTSGGHANLRTAINILQTENLEHMLTQAKVGITTKHAMSVSYGGKVYSGLKNNYIVDIGAKFRSMRTIIDKHMSLDFDYVFPTAIWDKDENKKPRIADFRRAWEKTIGELDEIRQSKIAFRVEGTTIHLNGDTSLSAFVDTLCQGTGSIWPEVYAFVTIPTSTRSMSAIFVPIGGHICWRWQ
nr:MAG: hypothetical protein [Crogonang virus 25]